MATKRGFVPCRKLSGGPTITKTYPVSAAGNDAYFLGDFVTLKTSGKLRPLKGNDASAVRPLGCIVGLLDANQKPLVFKQPSAGPYLATAVAGYAMICLANNGQTFAAEYGAAYTDAVAFSGVQVSGGTPSTTLGLSGQSLTGTAITSSDAHFQVIGLAPEGLIASPRDKNTATSAVANAIVEVIVVNPALGNYLV